MSLSRWLKETDCACATPHFVLSSGDELCPRLTQQHLKI